MRIWIKSEGVTVFREHTNWNCVKALCIRVTQDGEVQFGILRNGFVDYRVRLVLKNDSSILIRE